MKTTGDEQCCDVDLGVGLAVMFWLDRSEARWLGEGVFVWAASTVVQYCQIVLKFAHSGVINV